MNILVFSDSHGRTSRILEAFERQVKRPDAIAFLGDGLWDISYCDFGTIPLYAVCGNCDFYSLYESVHGEKETLITLGGKRIFMTHGHDYSVKSSLGRLVVTAVKKEADIVFFGHTHIPFEKYLPAGESEYGIDLPKPLYMMNPGSIGGFDGSWGCVEINDCGNIVLSHGAL